MNTTTTALPRPAERPVRRLPKAWRVLAIGAAALSGATAAASVGAGSAHAVPAPRPLQVVAVYRITISGTVSGNRFTVTGTATLAPRVTNVTTNGLNPYEVCLKVGFPAGVPQRGAIWYGSNSACFPSRGADLDLVYASASGANFQSQPDSRLQATHINNWTSSSSITACLFSPISGRTTTSFNNTNIGGTISLTGFGGAFCGYSVYSASFSGVRIA